MINQNLPNYSLFSQSTMHKEKSAKAQTVYTTHTQIFVHCPSCVHVKLHTHHYIPQITP